MKTDKSELPIAVIDSGLGGISVLKELVKLMPNENYIYFGDSANAPYGDRSREEVLDIMLENAHFLISRGVKAIVVACNTATSAAVRPLRALYPELPIVGIEPAIKPATLVCEHPNVLVMATVLTLKEEKFKSLCERFASEESIIPLPCPGLMELIESGDGNSVGIEEYLKALFEPLKGTRIDAVVLGCTHYPFVADEIHKLLYEVTGNSAAIIDGGAGTAREARRRIAENGLLRHDPAPGKIEFISTSGDEKLIKRCNTLLYSK